MPNSWKTSGVLMKNRPKIGIGVILIKGNKVLLGKRKNVPDKGAWGPPGGHLEFDETPEACARREVLEETGIRVERVKFLTFTNHVFRKERRHYITLYFVSDSYSGKPKVTEPDKLEIWEWFEWGKFPKPLFSTFKSITQNYNPFK